MDGSKASSWASQSVSSSRHMGGATADSSPLLVSRMAGTCPVGASFQCGMLGVLVDDGPRHLADGVARGLGADDAHAPGVVARRVLVDPLRVGSGGIVEAGSLVAGVQSRW